MQILSRENKGAILGAVHLKTETVDIPEWGDGVSVIVTELSGVARDAYVARQGGSEKRTISQQQAELLIAAVVDESGAPLFDESDIEMLRAQKAEVIDRIAAVVVRINGLGATAVEDAAKNSEAAQSGASGSASQPISAAQ
ncbi:hypothetical protein [Ralstonia thomasii]|jgi:hypothetical protein